VPNTHAHTKPTFLRAASADATSFDVVALGTFLLLDAAAVDKISLRGTEFAPMRKSPMCTCGERDVGRERERERERRVVAVSRVAKKSFGS
jgi:hypothetical protein